MEVTKENFQQVLPLIEQAIKECDFLAFDTELTGLSASRSQRINNLDSVEERYQKVRSSATSFQTIQWGLSAFKWDPESSRFVARPFNFYVFPKPFNRSFEYTFVSQVSSLHFLASHNFDFNKLIYSGIPYLRKDEEQRLRAQLAPTSRDEVPLTSEDRKFIAGVLARIDDWLQNSVEKELKLEPCNAYQRRISYQEIEKKYNRRLHAQTKGEEGSYQRFLVISRLTEEEKRQKEAEQRSVSEEELNQAVGFRRVLDMVSESKKPLVGHNMFLDAVHTFGFLSYPPDSCNEFKSRLHAAFPTLIDTKYLASWSPLIGGLIPSTALDEAYSTVLKEPFVGPKIELAEGFDRYADSSNAFHEAGFDAYATGVLYLRMAQYIASRTSHPVTDILPEGELIQSYVNKLYLMHSDISYLNVTGQEEEPSRDNVFWVKGFPPETQTSDIIRHFQPLGSIVIKWIDETSLLATVQDPDKVPLVIPHFASVRPPFMVLDWETYAAASKAQRERDTTMISPRRPFTPSPPRRGVKRVYETPRTPIPEEKEAKEEGEKESNEQEKEAKEPEAKRRKEDESSMCIVC